MGTPTNTRAPIRTEYLLRCDEVGALISVRQVTLAEWRRLGKGPKSIRLNGRVARYRWSDVEAWLVSQEVRPSRTVAVPAGAALRAARGSLS